MKIALLLKGSIYERKSIFFFQIKGNTSNGKGIKGHIKQGRMPKSPNRVGPKLTLDKMLKRFYLLSFALAFLSLGAVAQPLLVVEDFQVNDDCGNPPFVIDDNNSSNYWKYEFTATSTANKPLSNHSIWRYLTIDIYKVDGGTSTLEATILQGPTLVSGGVKTFHFGSDDIDLSTGSYEVHLHVRYTNGSGVPSGNMYMTVKKNGSTVCGQQSFAGDGEVECDLGRITCFDYQGCHEITLTRSIGKFGSWRVNLNINGGTGPFNISWILEEYKVNPLPGGPNSLYYNDVYSVPMPCGTWTYSIVVEDLTTGCVMKMLRTFTRPCVVTLPNDKELSGGRSAAEELQFELFPNPVSNGIARISYELPTNTIQAQLEIYNLQGQVVKSVVIDPLSSEMKIKLGDLANGLYVANLSVDGQRIGTQRMVINH